MFPSKKAKSRRNPGLLSVPALSLTALAMVAVTAQSWHGSTSLAATRGVSATVTDLERAAPAAQNTSSSLDDKASALTLFNAYGDALGRQ